MRKLPTRAENPTAESGPCATIWPSHDGPAIPKAVSLGFGLSELAHNRRLVHFKILSSRQVDDRPTNLLTHQTAKALKMSAAPTTKTFGKSTRTVPHPSEKAQKWYPVEDEPKPRKVCERIHSQNSRDDTAMSMGGLQFRDAFN